MIFSEFAMISGVVGTIGLLIILLLKGDRRVREEIKSLRVGDVWVMKNESPWPAKNDLRVKIVELKDGWVRFSFLRTHMPQDERLRARSFVYIYQKMS